MTYEDAMLWLVMGKNMWHRKIALLMRKFGSPGRVWKASYEQLVQSGILKEEDAGELCESRENFDPAAEWCKLEQKGIRFLTDRSEEFPKKLLDIPDRPYALFIKGCIHSDETEKRVAVIGARVCSAYGRYAAGKFAGELAEYGIATVSGMARGVDSAAHQGTVDAGGRTYAILGCGVDICYPPENKYLYDRIIEQGAVLSEYPPGTRPNAWQFPERNRLISGMADCVVITEARQKSGSLITVKHALEQGVDVCAVPGRINDVLSNGCNRLIQEGAFPATSTLDILFNMGINVKKNEKTKIFLEKQNEVLYSVLDLQPQTPDEIMQKTGMNRGTVYEGLLWLLMHGLAEEPVKNYYIRKE